MKVILKPGRERSLLQRHPWIFSGAIEEMPDCQDGEVLPVYSSAGVFLAQAYFHPNNSLTGRVLSFSQEPVEKVLFHLIERAIFMRRNLLEQKAFRLINGEGDGIPGLIVDCYGDVLVMQINTWGIELLRDFFVRSFVKLLPLRSIYEKSISSARDQEGLPKREGFLFGEEIHETEIEENGIRYIVPLTSGQKTGFFLDQREMRKMVGAFAKDKRVLNCFSYTGGFSLQAMKGGAKHVVSVDVSAPALQLLDRNLGLNTLSGTHESVCEDVFDYLHRFKTLPFDFVILDPPAFVKKRSNLSKACDGYTALHRAVLERLPPNSLLLTSSCSAYVDRPLFQKILFDAAIQAKRDLKILSGHISAIDHPVSIYHPEGDYLKSLFLEVT